MVIHYTHPDWEHSVVWEFDTTTGWTGYHQELDEILAYTRKSDDRFVLIFQPNGDVPRGQSLSHMKRLVQATKDNAHIIQTVVIMQLTWFISKAFVQVLNRLTTLEPEVKIVFSEEEARAVQQAAMTEIIERH